MTFFKSMVIAAVVLTAMVGAQEQQAPKPKAQEQYTLSVGTNLVLVPVIVTDKKGNHITGLKQEDFELKEDGAVQKIVRVDELSADAAKVEAASPGPNVFSNQIGIEHPKKMEIIVIDQINTPFASSADAKRGIIQFLSKNADANTLLALVAFQPNGVRLIHNFTSDPAVLVSAVRKVHASLTSRDTRAQDVPGDTSEVDAEVLQIQALFSGIDLTGGASPSQILAATRAQSTQARAQADASRQSQDALVTLECLQELAQYFGGVPGRKSLIWASSGFPFSFGASAREVTRGTTQDDWQRTFEMLQDANVAVYPVDVSGLLPGGGANNLQSINSNAMRNRGAEGGAAARSQTLEAVTSGRFVDPTEGRHETMRQVAEATGGQAFYNSNNASELFRNAGDDSGHYYVLAYYTKNTTKQGWRKLSVKVHRDGTRIRARSGYFFHQPGSDAEASRAEEMMAFSSDLSFTGVPIRGVWEQVELVGNQRKVPFRLVIPAAVPLVDTEHENHISMDFRVLVKDSSGQVAANLGQRLDTKLDQQGVEQIRTKGLDYTNLFTVAPGEYKVHFVVRDNLRGTLGSVVVPLTVQ